MSYLTPKKYSNYFSTPSTSYYDLDEFLTPFSQLFDSITKDTFPSISDVLGKNFFDRGSYPKVDVIDFPEKTIIEAEIPGLTKENIEITLNDKCLSIAGKKQDSVDSTRGTILYKELKRSSFKRSFMLGENYTDNINAEFSNGILKISLEKINKTTPPPESKKIEIK